jgi:hypothetical protein
MDSKLQAISFLIVLPVLLGLFVSNAYGGKAKSAPVSRENVIANMLDSVCSNELKAEEITFSDIDSVKSDIDWIYAVRCRCREKCNDHVSGNGIIILFAVEQFTGKIKEIGHIQRDYSSANLFILGSRVFLEALSVYGSTGWRETTYWLYEIVPVFNRLLFQHQFSNAADMEKRYFTNNYIRLAFKYLDPDARIFVESKSFALDRLDNDAEVELLDVSFAVYSYDEDSIKFVVCEPETPLSGSRINSDNQENLQIRFERSLVDTTKGY